jgi:hypothetical protein
MTDDSTFSFDDETIEEEQEQRPNPVRELRKTLKARDKELKEYKAELEELRAFRTQYEAEKKVADSTASFEKYGLSPKHVELYFKMNPDAEVTPEAIKGFAEDYALPYREPEGEPGDQSGPVSRPSDTKPFAPADTGTSSDGWINRDQLDSMYKENPQRALQYLRAGRVRWNNPDDN